VVIDFERALGESLNRGGIMVVKSQAKMLLNLGSRSTIAEVEIKSGNSTNLRVDVLNCGGCT
jgi:hypothetical protein